MSKLLLCIKKLSNERNVSSNAENWEKLFGCVRIPCMLNLEDSLQNFALDIILSTLTLDPPQAAEVPHDEAPVPGGGDEAELPEDPGGDGDSDPEPV